MRGEGSRAPRPAVPEQRPGREALGSWEDRLSAQAFRLCIPALPSCPDSVIVSVDHCASVCETESRGARKSSLSVDCPTGSRGERCSAPSASTRISPEASGSVDLGLWVSKLLDLSKGEKKNKIRKTGTKKESNSVHLRLAQFRGLRA